MEIVIRNGPGEPDTCLYADASTSATLKAGTEGGRIVVSPGLHVHAQHSGGTSFVEYTPGRLLFVPPNYPRVASLPKMEKKSKEEKKPKKATVPVEVCRVI